jgi:hypothetical protein
MNDSHSNLHREVCELKAEVRRLRRLIEGSILIIALGLVMVFPNLLVVSISLGVLILFGILVSRQRLLIFNSFLRRRDIPE